MWTDLKMATCMMYTATPTVSPKIDATHSKSGQKIQKTSNFLEKDPVNGIGIGMHSGVMSRNLITPIYTPVCHNS